MHCLKCGRENENNGKFCEYCGAEIQKGNVVESKVSENSDIKEPKINSILALLFSFILAPIGLILSIIGLVRSKSYKKKTGETPTSIVLNIVGIIFSAAITLGILVTGFSFGFLYKLFSAQDEQLKGTWNCSFGSFNQEYVAKVTFDNYDEFKWTKYGDSEKNNYTGTYEILSRKHANGKNQYTVLLKLQNKIVDRFPVYNMQKNVIDVEFYNTNAIIESENDNRTYYCIKAH